MSVVYFIGCAGRIKIGVTKNLKSRVGALQTSAPDKLAVIAIAPGSTRLERDLHEKLRPHRLTGEWFNDCEEVRGAIAETVAATDGIFDPDIRVQVRPLPPQQIVAASPAPDEDWSSIDLMLEAHRVASKRFGEFIDSVVLKDMGTARKLERKLGLESGSIIKKIYQCEDPGELHYSTLVNLNRLHEKLIKAGDRVTLAIVNQDFAAADGLARAAEVLMESGEKAFAALKAVHRPIVYSTVKPETHIGFDPPQ
jgi:hypothetical protein